MAQSTTAVKRGVSDGYLENWGKIRGDFMHQEKKDEMLEEIRKRQQKLKAK